MDFGRAFTSSSAENKDFWPVVIALILAVITYGLYKIIKLIRNEGRPLDYKKYVTLNGKTVLITGANCGLGKATALDLAARGARVILACRNREKAEAAAEEIKRRTGNPNVSIINLDLSDLDSVKAAAGKVVKTYDRLDVLINNAGIGITDKKITKQGFDMIFGTNYLGHFIFTQILLELLKKSAPSRIINVTSNALNTVRKKLNYDPTMKDEMKYPFLQGYPISKLANYFHVKTLVEKLRGTGVTANAVHPGYIQTRLRDIEYKNKNFLKKMFWWISKLFRRTERDYSKTIVHLAVDPELKEVTGEYFTNFTRRTNKLTAIAKDREEAEKLSNFSYDIYLSIHPLVFVTYPFEKRMAPSVSTCAENLLDDTDDNKREKKKREALLHPREQVFVEYALDRIAAYGDRKENKRERRKRENLLQPIDRVFVKYTNEEILMGAHRRAKNLMNKERDEKEERKYKTQLQSTQADFASYAVEQKATTSVSTCARNFVNKKKDKTEAAFVKYAAGERDNVGVSTFAKNLNDRKEDERRERKEESQVRPMKATSITYEFDEIATTGAPTYVKNFNKKEHKQEAKKQEIQSHPKEAAFVTYEAEEMAIVGGSICAKNSFNRKYEKKEVKKEKTEAAYVTYASTMGVSTCAQNLKDRKKDEQKEMKPFRPTETIFVTDAMAKGAKNSVNKKNEKKEVKKEKSLLQPPGEAFVSYAAKGASSFAEGKGETKGGSQVRYSDQQCRNWLN